MPDVLIRDLPDEVIAGLDARAQRVGVSRSELLRRIMTREATVSPRPVTVEDFKRIASRYRDLADPDVMADAWR